MTISMTRGAAADSDSDSDSDIVSSVCATPEFMARLVYINLLDVPGILQVVARLYRVPDSARQFVPPDTNITGSP
jgi:hypothetical protein